MKQKFFIPDFTRVIDKRYQKQENKMKIYDISQELTGCVVYPGDITPQKELASDMEKGALYNLTNISFCTHNGTHIDAPFHFVKDGRKVNEIPLEKFIGPCYVICHKGDFTKQDAETLTADMCSEAKKRILISGDATVTSGAAEVFANKGIYLLGNESQTVGPEDSPMQVHKILLEKDVVLLEGIRLFGIKEGEYFLCAQPVNIEGSDGAPCRAVLIEF